MSRPISIAWPVKGSCSTEHRPRSKDGTVLVQERPITPRGVQAGYRTVPSREDKDRSETSAEESIVMLENWVIGWAERMCEKLDASPPSSARNAGGTQVLSARSARQAKPKAAPPRARGNETRPESVAVIHALAKLERAFEDALDNSARSDNLVVSPRQAATSALYGGKGCPAARASVPKGSIKGAPSDGVPTRHSLGRAGVHKVYSGPGGKASARFMEVTEALGPRVYSECTLTRSAQTALSAVMSSPRSNLMPDTLSRSSPVMGQMEMRVNAAQGDDPRSPDDLHTRLDRMQELIDQGQKHSAEQLKWLRADYEELARMRAEEAGQAGECFDSSSSSGSEDENGLG